MAQPKCLAKLDKNFNEMYDIFTSNSSYLQLLISLVEVMVFYLWLDSAVSSPDSCL
jgi:hypothetical protein